MMDAQISLLVDVLPASQALPFFQTGHLRRAEGLASLSAISSKIQYGKSGQHRLFSSHSGQKQRTKENAEYVHDGHNAADAGP